MKPTVKRPLFLIGPVTEESCDNVVKSLWSYALDDDDPGPSRNAALFISSEGGDVPLGWSIIETIREVKNSAGLDVDTYVMGECSSIAIPIFLSATGQRIATRNASFFIHNLQVENASGQPASLSRLSKALHWMNDSLYEFILSKTKVSPTMLKGMMDRDCHFTGEEAMEMGFATQLR